MELNEAIVSLVEKTGGMSEDVRAAFWRLISHMEVDENGCWLSTYNLDDLGYARPGNILGETRAHRVSYAVFKGPISDGMNVNHSCDVRHCFNPEHLSEGTQAENVRDMMLRGRWVSGDNSGEKNGQSKLNWFAVKEIRNLYGTGRTQASIADQFGVSRMCVNRVVLERSWK